MQFILCESALSEFKFDILESCLDLFVGMQYIESLT